MPPSQTIKKTKQNAKNISETLYHEEADTVEPTETQLREYLFHTRRTLGPNDPKTLQAERELKAIKDKKRAERPNHQKLQIAHQTLKESQRAVQDATERMQVAEARIQSLRDEVLAAEQEHDEACKHLEQQR